MAVLHFIGRCWKEINITALKNNFNYIKKISGVKVCAVVKADAYGHGAIAVAKALIECGADFFAVSNIQEAEELRAADIKAPLLILGYTPVECAKKIAELDVIQCVSSLDYATALDSEAKKAGVALEVHIKLDTGMCRLGFDFRTDDFCGFDAALSLLSLSSLNVSGAFTHFSSADGGDESDAEFTKAQQMRFTAATKALEKEGFKFKVKHSCNSAATLLGMGQEMVRAGIILYGLTPSDKMTLPEEIKPVMSFYSVVSQVMTVEKGSAVSYGRTYVTDGTRRIATVSAGYADGVPRVISNKGSVIIRGKRAKIVGRICMDQFCVDVTDIDDVKIGDKVTIFGGELSVDEIAEQAGTINYEIVCGISKRVETKMTAE